MESFPNFRKLWGRIDTQLPLGDYTVNIKNGNIIKHIP